MLTKSYAVSLDMISFRNMLPLNDDRTLVFLDIETMGLNRKRDPIILIGLMILGSREGSLYQYFSQNPGDEREILQAMSEIIPPEAIIVTYNGQSFDIPYVNYRSAVNDLPYRISKGRGVDLMRLAKKAMPDAPRYTLKAIEVCLGIHRDDTLSGAECVRNYETYLKTKEHRLAEEICRHNYEDVLHMAPLLQLFDVLPQDSPLKVLPFYLSIGQRNFWIDAASCKNGYLMIKGGTEHPESPGTSCYRGSASLQISRRVLEATLPIIEFNYPSSGSLFIDSDRIPGFMPIPFNQLSMDSKMDLMVRSGEQYLAHALTSALIRLISQNK